MIRAVAEIVVSIVLLAGFALMFGATEAAEKLQRFAIGAWIAFTLGLCVLAYSDRSGLCFPSVSERVVALAAAAGLLAVIGFVAWRTRNARAARREARARRSSAPRERELPTAPQGLEEDP